MRCCAQRGPARCCSHLTPSRKVRFSVRSDTSSQSKSQAVGSDESGDPELEAEDEPMENEPNDEKTSDG